MRPFLRYLKKWSFRIFCGVFCLLLFIFLCDIWVDMRSSRFLYEKIEDIPQNKVGLVLGTTRYTKGNRINLFFKYRMDAAAQLYHQNKVKHLIVSGDNRTITYDEATTMMKALKERGVPEEAITRDYAGFRTLDSVVRCREVFGQNKFTIISQEFHNARATFIARAKGMEVVAFNARGVSRRHSPKTYLREYLARVKAALDLYVLRTGPKFLGEKIEIKA